MRNYKYYSLALILMLLGFSSCADEDFDSTSLADLDPIVTLSGSASVTTDDVDVAYSVIERRGSTYVWSATTGGTITADEGTTSSVTVDFGSTAGTVTISVTETTVGGKTDSADLEVTVSDPEV